MDQAKPESIPLDELFTIREFANRHARLLTESTLRYQLRNRHANGLAATVVPLGHHALIWEPGYFRWLGTLAGKKAGP